MSLREPDQFGKLSSSRPKKRAKNNSGQLVSSMYLAETLSGFEGSERIASAPLSELIVGGGQSRPLSCLGGKTPLADPNDTGVARAGNDYARNRASARIHRSDTRFSASR